MPPLTRAEFLALARLRGYSLAAVGKLFGVSRSRMSQIAAEPNRPPHWDYALWALPPRKALAKFEARRRRILTSLSATSLSQQTSQTVETKLPTLELGDVWIVDESPGEHLPQGCTGTVQFLSAPPGIRHATFYFPSTGYQESFAVSYLEQPNCFLRATGRNELISSTSETSEPETPMPRKADSSKITR